MRIDFAATARESTFVPSWDRDKEGAQNWCQFITTLCVLLTKWQNPGLNLDYQTGTFLSSSSEVLQDIYNFASYTLQHLAVAVNFVPTSSDALELEFHEPSRAELKIFRAEPSWTPKRNELNPSWIF